MSSGSARLDAVILNSDSRGGDFSTLLLDTNVDGDGPQDEALNGELIAFDQLDAEPFALFNNGTPLLHHQQQPANSSNCSSSEDMSPLRAAAAASNAAAIMNAFPLNTFLAQHGSFLATVPGVDAPPPGLLDMDERVLAAYEHELSNSGGNLADWALPSSSDASVSSSHNHSGCMHYNLQCGSCQILHCIIHSNGVQDTKLEIHGCDGQSYNAVLHTRFCVDDGFPSTLEQQMVEFPVGNAEYVKQFLLQYSLLRRKEGFVLRHDSTGSFDPSHFGMGPDCLNDPSAQYPKSFAGRSLFSDLHCSSAEADGKPLLGANKANRSNSLDSLDHGDTSILPTKPPKSNAAAQRERTGKLKMSDLAQHFHLPINAAAKELGICPTVLKKICRRNGMRRWPHRKIKSIERIIATLEQTIAEGAGQGDEGIRMEIAMLRNERAQLCAGLLGEKVGFIA